MMILERTIEPLDRFTRLTMAYVDVYLYLSPPGRKGVGRKDVARLSHEAVAGAVDLINAQTSAQSGGRFA